MSRELTDIVGESQTLVEAFKKLDKTEIMIDTTLGSSYNVLSARKEFVILEEANSKARQLLHPYGTRLGYFIPA